MTESGRSFFQLCHPVLKSLVTGASTEDRVLPSMLPEPVFPQNELNQGCSGAVSQRALRGESRSNDWQEDDFKIWKDASSILSGPK